MSWYSTLKKSFFSSCYGFSAIVIAYSLIMVCMYGSGANMSVLSVLQFFPFAWLIALCNEWLKASHIRRGVAALIRYCAVVLAFFICICFPHRDSLSPAVGVVLFFALTVVYTIVALVCAFVENKGKTDNAYSNKYRK